jgi:hypothetical protein
VHGHRAVHIQSLNRNWHPNATYCALKFRKVTLSSLSQNKLILNSTLSLSFNGHTYIHCFNRSHSQTLHSMHLSIKKVKLSSAKKCARKYLPLVSNAPLQTFCPMQALSEGNSTQTELEIIISVSQVWCFKMQKKETLQDITYCTYEESQLLIQSNCTCRRGVYLQ